ncbi:hypothetical protein DP124_12080 [Clostridium tetani]|uniref:DUF2634 domain-containing protein n=1 Tax=Clostridium tetani TaxID=1513 RepID=UPI00100A64F0|nr:DUF2634 domain-containing protein [Clostridium tetani]RXI50201.1 hypothetical protein DP124_12080 [Clostridium tetani]
MEEQYLFPFFQDEIKEYEEENTDILEKDTDEIYKDIAWDFDNNKPILMNGDFVIAEGLDAVKSWAFRALQTQRAKYKAFTWDYAIDLESFIGKVLTTKEKIDLTIEIKECLLQNKHITNVTDFNFKTDKRKVYIRFRIITEYGDFPEGVKFDEAI